MSAMDARPERLALNEAAFRQANERMTTWPERQETQAGERLTFYCECATTACRQHLSLTLREYESVRANSRRFVIVPGHDEPEFERVVDEHERYAVIEKEEDMTALVKATDPRSR